MKPLITFITFNRMGGTIEALNALLSDQEDFDLCLLDNFSQDKTWDYLNSINDPRIKLRKRFNRNVGGAWALNYGLTFRKPEQDWINIEFDFALTTPNFIKIFKEYKQAYPNIGGFSAVLNGDQNKKIEDTGKIVGNELKLYYDTIMGFCWFIPNNVMNQLKYMDEVSSLQDVELNSRIRRGLKLKTAYAMNIKGDPIHYQALDFARCVKCKTMQSFCEGDIYKNPTPCAKPYSRITSDWYNIYRKPGDAIVEERISGKRPLKCESIHDSLNKMSEKDKEMSLKHSQFFTDAYQKHLKGLK